MEPPFADVIREHLELQARNAGLEIPPSETREQAASERTDELPASHGVEEHDSWRRARSFDWGD
jgi:hypothetical protein